MEIKEAQDQFKNEFTSVLSLFGSEEHINIHPRRVKSDPLPMPKFSFQYFSDKNTLNNPLPETNLNQYNPGIDSNDDVHNNTSMLITTNSYGFIGRSPYVTSSNINNNINSKNNIKDENINPNINEKIINGFIFTELKDKVFEYRCSVCNFVAHANGELHKHLALNKHFILPKKYKKNNKSKAFHKSENSNRLNQTFMFSMNKHKKYSDKKLTCKHCSKRFESNYALNSHLNAHKYKCDICYKLFNNKEDLEEHKHDLEEKEEMNSPIKKKRNKFHKEQFREKNKIEIDDWEEVLSNKKDKKIKKEEIGESYAFVDNDENIDFNKMVKIHYEI